MSPLRVDLDIVGLFLYRQSRSALADPFHATCRISMSGSSMQLVRTLTTIAMVSLPTIPIAAQVSLVVRPSGGPQLPTANQHTEVHPAALVALAPAERPPETVDHLPAPAIGLADLEQLAMTHNPALAAAAARVDAARGRAWQAGLYPNPVAGYSGEDMGDLATAGKQGAFVSQRFVTAGKLRLDQAVAEQQVAAAEQQWAAWRQRILADVGLGFYDVLIAQRRVETTEQLASVAESTVKTAAELVEAQETSRVDVLQARVEFESNKIRMQKSRNAHVAAWRRLAAVLGTPEMSPQRLLGDVDAARRDITWEAARGRVLNESPEIAVAQARLQQARFALQRAQAGRIPDLDVRASVHKDDTTGDTVSGVEIGVPLPIFDRNQGAIAQAAADVAAAEQQIRHIEVDLQRRLAMVYQRYADARFEVDKYVHDIRPSAKESLELASKAYRAGESSYFTLLTAQRMYFRTDLAYIESLHNLWRASIEIDGLLLTNSRPGPALTD